MPEEKKKSFWSGLFKFAIGVVVAIVIINNLPSNSSSSSTKLKEAETTASKMTMEQFKETAIDVSYDELKRNPDKYTGKSIVMKLYIAQIVSNKQWRAYTYGNSQWSRYDTDEEFYVFDKRTTGTNIIEKDVVTVYGIYRGVASVTRALTGTTEKVPSIEVYKLELNN